ncbi:UPF0507 protein [Suhomyces tanzawaensis NRRL Y-17324]|uniref:UPF0507 protein n=1 Tax=Suhomyces tanzawaensis NRRL Y-17324 TaxID=984487 RepID=A0A1E4SHQ1_9ASCO|nr:UPF0507 protein [Suhomyces tanzawaensis NRRL Y-17324]ODV78952.1 UPF0507 protein [Suhomyces tanzawaensis NRRL Y-17324]
MSSHKSHLPLLYNPYINCIFNNPNHARLPFKSTIDELAKSHLDYTILIPPSYILQEWYDPVSTKYPLKELCYSNEDFIRSHIIKTSSTYSISPASNTKVQLVIYNTINGKQILIKNGMVFTGKGFKRSLKLQILSTGYIRSFCDYFPKGSRFMVIYIEDTLIGSYHPHVSQYQLLENPQEPPPLVHPKVSEPQPSINESITFEKLLRTYPLLSKAVSDKFYRLFHHNNRQFRLLHTNNQKQLSQIKSEFQAILEEAYKIILDSVKVENPESEQTYNLINHIIGTYPGLDLNRLVHEYVELNLYDKIWSQLMFQFNYRDPNKKEFDPDAQKFLTTEKYRKLSCLALNQLDIPIDKPWELNELQLRVFRAIDEFSKLADPGLMNLNNKTKVIFRTMEVLTVEIVTEPTTIDADTLIGLIIMIIIHSKIDNIEAHLYYMKHFNSIDYTNDGHFNYIMSNFDAVLYLLSHEDGDLVQYSQQNFDFWSTIQNGDLDNLKSILDSVQEEYQDTLPVSHFLKSKNIKGESCLMFGVKTKKFEVWDLLLNYNPAWFTIDDLLFDKDIVTNQNLLMTALIEESNDIALDLVQLLLYNTSDEEMSLYLNSKDTTGRSIGHYLFHNYQIIPIIGHLIDWELKDLNHHTPLFSICRCYDHLHYDLMLKEAFDCVYEKYGKVNFDVHKDKLSNGLLHIVARNLEETRLLSNPDNLIDINELNGKFISPLVNYVKYNRAGNLKDLLKDPRLDFLLEDTKNFYNVFDYVGMLAMKSIGNKSEEFKQIEQLILDYYVNNFFPNSENSKLTALNAKFGSSKKEWLIFFKDTNGYSNYKSLETIKQFIYLTKIKNPYSIFPEDEFFWLNFGAKKSTTPFFQKNRVNRLIEKLNMLFVSLEYQNNVDRNEFFQSFLVQESQGSLTLEAIRAVHEKRKLEMGDVKLGEAQIKEMEFFLEYSVKDLSSYKVFVSRFNKLLIFAEMKQSDLRYVQDKALEKLAHGGEGDSRENCHKDSLYGVLNDFSSWIELCVASLLKNIYKVLEKIRHWKELYMGIKELNSEIKKYEASIRPEHEEGDASNTTGPPTPSRRNTFTIDDIPDEADDESMTFFNLGGMIESKRSRYKKLVLIKADKIKQIMKLNVDIKWDHEALASEISTLLKFKSNFMRFAVKRFTAEEIQRLHHRNYQLQKVLQNVTP